MKHISVPIANTMEFIQTTKISPLIDKCMIKVCYIGENRNDSVIDKEAATILGENLPGSPIVGFYNKEEQDFEEHNKEILITDDKFELIDTTRPYGFVPTNAQVWFEKFTDDGIEHEYLMTEGYLWTSAYPECKRVITQGNNQSMELDKEKTTGIWTTSDNLNKRFFIINDGLIEKLCILGEDYEPCFEGAQIRQSFMLENKEFKMSLFSMIEELKEALNKGGFNQIMDENKVIEEQEVEYKEKPQKEDKEDSTKNQEEEDKKNIPPKKTDNSCNKDNKKEYILEEIQEYIDLKTKYDTLQNNFTVLQQEKEELAKANEELRQFKLTADRKEKQVMINSFYMLSDEDKQDVVKNIDTYSLDDIEAKLAITCVRNKVNFSEDKEDKPLNFSLNLGAVADDDNTVPAWVKAVKQNEQEDY